MQRAPSIPTGISCLLISGGALLLYFGARDFLVSRTGQREAARAFDARVRTSSAAPPVRGRPVARLRIPRLGTDLYVVEGDGAGELRRGPGHMAGTALPGTTGNCIIAGHRDTHFRVLKDIRAGDDIFLETHAGIFIYRVERTSIVTPDDTSSLRPTAEAQLNLITCYPFRYTGPAPKRFVVKAVLAGRTAPAS
jgi:sortase A